ncbi:trichohyalin isoform X3 [Cynoglossus semilaevis]|uniref:trichohyalin isoform X2 n=1 Tax=Cynoglossus semilaevis TaxID=244447 RepID=UPI000D62B5CB|nr:trichohyalin-like isoform X2 [Cynoglossus semilaevis]XP_024913549.1 trichohyalin-like isoform X3 [Cynoglossus semilaevis]
MDTTDEPFCRPVSVNGVYSVRYTEEVLLPVFKDESVKITMASPQLPPATPNSAPCDLSELRLVLLGRKGVGKSAVGHTILGEASGLESWRPTEECVKRQGSVVGKSVTVVDTPGWEWYYPLNSTPNWVRKETVRSVSLCPPGPHAVLLVVRACASVTEAYIREIEEHLQPLGRGVWEHTMLLFTRGDELGLTTMEQRILTSGPALQRLLQKCGSRYHVVNNHDRGDRTQVQELIRKVVRMVEEKKGVRHLEMDSTLLVGLEADKGRRARERRRKQRQMEAQTQRGTIRDALTSDVPQGFGLDAHQSFSKSPRQLHEIRLVLLGERETGKSAAGNTILGKNSFFTAGVVTEECTSQQAEVTRRCVTVVDTPGWEAGVAGATPERVKREIVSSVALCPPGPHALLLTLRVDTLVRAAHVREHLELLGGGVWRHIILLFTHGDQLRAGVDIQHHIQNGGRDLQWLLERCRGRYHVISSVGGAGDGGRGTVTELLEKVEKVAAMNRCEAFSNLVQEVRDLSQQRNQQFNQRLKEMGDKVLRQQEELRNMKEQEMKRLGWFLNRKKKVKSPGKVHLQREEEEEEEEERRTGETKADFGELEERMRWLVEDKEREIQDLSLENQRNLVTLNQNREEREKLMLQLELRERETEELKERMEEQQVKLLDLERTGVEKEQMRKQMEEAVRGEAGRWKKEVEKLRETVEVLTAEMNETSRRCDAALSRKEQEHVGELRRLQEEVQLETTEGLKLQHQEEMVRKISELEKLMEKTQVQQQRETVQKLKEKEKELDRVKKKHENETSRLKDLLVKETEKHLEAAERQKRFEHQMKEKTLQSKKEKEMILSNHNREKEKEIELLKRQHRGEMLGKLKEMGKVQRENEECVKNLHQDYKKQIKEMQELNQSEVEEKVTLLKELKKQLHKREAEMTALEEKFLDQLEENMLESEIEREIIQQNHQKQVEQKLKEKEKELDELKAGHCEEMKEREEEIEKLHTVIEGKEAEKKEAVEKLKDLEEEWRREAEEQRAWFSTETQKQLEEKQREIKEMEQKFVFQMEDKTLQHQREVEINHQSHRQLVEELQSRHVHEIEQLKQESEAAKRGYRREMEEKEGEAKEVKTNLISRAERQMKQEKVDQYEQEVKKRDQDVQRKEEQVESLLRVLEGKQQELSFHGEDLQKKVKGLKEHSQELRDREHHLINEEQELLKWKSELQARDDHINSTTQQLDEMGRDLTLLREELRKKEANMKMFMEKLNKWQQSLEARESAFQKKEENGLESVECDSSNNRRVEGRGQIQMYQEVSERREEGRGTESDKGEQIKEREDLRRKIGESATSSLKCQFETLKETEVMEEREERRKVQRVNQDLLLFSQGQGHTGSDSTDSPGSYLRVMVLGETWSPRSPAGVSVLGGEDVRSKENGSTFRCWRGQIGGRNLAIAEPLGLRWRDGPDVVCGLQKKSLVDSRSWCHPGPHIVLLLIPAFLTCTQKYRRALEEQLALIGEDTWQRTLVVFTWGETLGVSAEQHILRNGELMTLVEKCEGRFHVLSNKKKTTECEELLEKMEALTRRGQCV